MEFGEKLWTRAVVAFGVVVAVVFAVNIHGCEASERVTTCKSHLTRLIQGWRDAVAQDRFDPTLHGSAQILSWHVAREREEFVYFCPDDRDRQPPKSQEERNPFHPATPAAQRHAIGLGSYAVRDFETFPVTAGDLDAWILCDRGGDDGGTPHHKEGLMVAFSSGAVRIVTRKELGLGADDALVIGPTSPHAELQKMERP